MILKHKLQEAVNDTKTELKGTPVTKNRIAIPMINLMSDNEMEMKSETKETGNISDNKPAENKNNVQKSATKTVV